MADDQKKYIEIQIPRITFKDTKSNAYLIATIVIFAFFLGMLTDKVLFLQNSLIAQNSNIAPTPQTTNVLGNTNNLLQPTLAPQKADVAIGHLPVLGNRNAKVTLIEFADFQCPFCKKFEDETYYQIYDAYIKTNKIKFAYRQYPLSTIHPNSQKASLASECANEQNKFWEYHNLLYKNQQTWSSLALAQAADTFTSYSSDLGLNTIQFRSCLDTGKYQNEILEDTAYGNSAGVDGTPTFFVNGWRLVGAVPFAQIHNLIEQELKK